MEFLECLTLSQIPSLNLKAFNAQRNGVVNPGMVICLCQLGGRRLLQARTISFHTIAVTMPTINKANKIKQI